MILYFSGTGNSRHAAQRMADALGDTLLSLNDRIRSGDTSPVETGERLPSSPPPTPGASPVWCGTGCCARSCAERSGRGSS